MKPGPCFSTKTGAQCTLLGLRGHLIACEVPMALLGSKWITKLGHSESQRFRFCGFSPVGTRHAMLRITEPQIRIRLSERNLPLAFRVPCWDKGEPEGGSKGTTYDSTAVRGLPCGCLITKNKKGPVRNHVLFFLSSLGEGSRHARIDSSETRALPCLRCLPAQVGRGFGAVWANPITQRTGPVKVNPQKKVERET